MINRKLQNKLHNLSITLIHLPTSRQKHFSFLIERNHIISIGWSQSTKTHPIAAKYGYRYNGIHSELHVIKNFPYRIQELENFTLINIRIMKDKSLGLSKPCRKCQKMLADFNLKKVYFSDNAGIFQSL